jgi:RimJ/RimL family protein N-acetyltransferase
MILAGQDKLVAEWICARIKYCALTPYYTAIGLVDERGTLLAGVMYDNYVKHNIHIHIAAEPGKQWMTKTYLTECFRYPFEQLKVARLTGLVAASNWDARRFDEHLGFRHEGVIRHGMPDGDDVILYGMLKSECRFLRSYRNYGKALSTAGTGPVCERERAVWAEHANGQLPGGSQPH